MLGQEDADLDVIFAVPGQPVQLVHDDVLHVRVIGNTLEQRLQFRPVAGAGALALVNKLSDDLDVKLCRLARAVVALGVDREAFVVVARGLFSRMRRIAQPYA